MKAPEKIYLQPSAIERLPHQNIVYTKPLADNSIEYICTDAFIEKAAEYLMNYEFNDSPTIADRRKRVEEFKNYMKGE